MFFVSWCEKQGCQLLAATVLWHFFLYFCYEFCSNYRLLSVKLIVLSRKRRTESTVCIRSKFMSSRRSQKMIYACIRSIACGFLLIVHSVNWRMFVAHQPSTFLSWVMNWFMLLLIRSCTRWVCQWNVLHPLVVRSGHRHWYVDQWQIIPISIYSSGK